MTTVVPKLLFCETKHCQLPVWEIVTSQGVCIYYERTHRKGWRPIGVVADFNMGDTPVSVYDCVRLQRGQRVYILKERDGYIAPESWYERIPE